MLIELSDGFGLGFAAAGAGVGLNALVLAGSGSGYLTLVPSVLVCGSSGNNNSIGGFAESNATLSGKGYLNVVGTGNCTLFDLNAYLEQVNVDVENIGRTDNGSALVIENVSKVALDEPFALVGKLKLVIESNGDSKSSNLVKTFALNSKDNGFASFGFGLVGNNGYFTVGSKCGNAQSENHQSHQDY